MEAKSEDTCHLTVGLLHHSNKNDVVSVGVAEEAAGTYKLLEKSFISQTRGTTSFFKTAFNGLNALSGSCLFLLPLLIKYVASFF